MARRRRPTKADEIKGLLADVFGPGDYQEIADKFASWDMGSPRGVLIWLRQYQYEGKLPKFRERHCESCGKPAVIRLNNEDMCADCHRKYWASQGVGTGG